MFQNMLLRSLYAESDRQDYMQMRKTTESSNYPTLYGSLDLVIALVIDGTS